MLRRHGCRREHLQHTGMHGRAMRLRIRLGVELHTVGADFAGRTHGASICIHEQTDACAQIFGFSHHVFQGLGILRKTPAVV